MKAELSVIRGAWLMFGRLALGAILTLAQPLQAVAVSPANDDAKGWTEKMQKWQDKMSEVFRDTWKALRGDSKKESVSTASVDLREQKDGYTLRLNLPDRDLDKVKITVEDGVLHIVAPAEGALGRYEQTLALPGVATDAQLRIDRKTRDNVIVVTVPKSKGLAEAKRLRTLPGPSLAPSTDWDREILARMAKMSRDMDRIFDDSFREFKNTPEHSSFFDEPRFGSSLDVKDEGNNYVVRAYLPDRNTKDVDVTVEGRTLRIGAKVEETTNEKGKRAIITHKAQYSQILTLPGPVQADKMKVDKKEGMLIVTLPKAA